MKFSSSYGQKPHKYGFMCCVWGIFIGAIYFKVSPLCSVIVPNPPAQLSSYESKRLFFLFLQRRHCKHSKCNLKVQPNNANDL